MLLLVSLALFAAAVWQGLRCVRGRQDGSGRDALLGVLLFYLSITAMRWAAGPGYMEATGQPPLNLWETVFDSAVHALQTFSMDEDYTTYLVVTKELCRELTGSAGAAALLGGFMAVQGFLAPIVGGAMLLSLLSDLFPGLACFFQQGRDKFVFSELNERSVLLAESLRGYSGALSLEGGDRPAGKRCIIFTDAYVDMEDEARAELLQRAKKLGICLQDDVTALRLRGKTRVTYFLMDRDEQANLDTAIELAGSYRELCAGATGVDILLFTRDGNANELVKDLQQGCIQDGEHARPDVTIKVVRDIAAAIYRLLNDYPLFIPLLEAPGAEEKLSLLVVGDTNACFEMIQAAYWCGHVCDHKTGKKLPLELHIVAPEGGAALRSRLAMAMPAVRLDESDEWAKFRFYDGGEDCRDLERVFRDHPALARCGYVMVDLKSDARNMETARWIRMRLDQALLLTPGRRAFVCYMVEDDTLARALNAEADTPRPAGQDPTPAELDAAERRKGKWHDCLAFGSMRERFSVENVFAPALERAAYEVNVTYEGGAGPNGWQNFQRDEYSRRSSTANVVHAKYKLFSVDPGLFLRNGALRSAPTYAELMALVQANTHTLAWLEHCRWCAYSLAIGLRCPSEEELAAYFAADPAGVDHKCLALNLHPCLVPSSNSPLRLRQTLGDGDWRGDWERQSEDGLDELDRLSLKYYRMMKEKFPEDWALVQSCAAELAPIVSAGWRMEPNGLMPGGGWQKPLKALLRKAHARRLGLSDEQAGARAGELDALVKRTMKLVLPTDFKQWDYDMLVTVPEFFRAKPESAKE